MALPVPWRHPLGPNLAETLSPSSPRAEASLSEGPLRRWQSSWHPLRPRRGLRASTIVLRPHAQPRWSPWFHEQQAARQRRSHSRFRSVLRQYGRIDWPVILWQRFEVLSPTLQDLDYLARVSLQAPLVRKIEGSRRSLWRGLWA